MPQLNDLGGVGHILTSTAKFQRVEGWPRAVAGRAVEVDEGFAQIVVAIVECSLEIRVYVEVLLAKKGGNKASTVVNLQARAASG